MPPRTVYHEPLTQGAVEQEELPAIQALYVQRPGVYVHSDDISAWLSRVSERYHGEGRVALLEAAQAFAKVDVDVETVEVAPVQEELAQPDLVYTELALEQANVDRIEIYPNSDGMWETRACDSGGFIVAQGPSSFQRNTAQLNAIARWPNKPIHELPDATGDSLWNEQRSSGGIGAGVLTGRPRPSPRRMLVTQAERPENARPA